MLEDFLSYITVHFSSFKENKILLAVSGGIDSMVMVHLFQECALDFGICHINHSTRNGQSDKDEEFVADYCSQFGIAYFTKKLDYKMLSKGNFQSNARKARYDFFDEILKRESFDFLATAHHMEDRWETFLMHLNRKAGLKGLASLRNKEGYIIRPLLGFSKKDIIQYATKNKIPFVHDVSNDTDDYLRNTIRHHITPKIEATFPSFIKNVNQSINHIDGTKSLVEELIDKMDFKSFDESSQVYDFHLSEIESFSNKQELMYQLLSPYNFSFSDIQEMLSSNRTGAYWESSSHEIIQNRGSLKLRKKKGKLEINKLIIKLGTYTLSDGRTLHVRPSAETDEPANIIDENKVSFPIQIRQVLAGDKFQPKGMKGKKKTLKKYCTDHKIDRFTKEHILVAVQDELIISIVNYQVAGPYISTTKKGIIIELES